MSQFLCATIHFLDPFPSFHGNRDNDEPEWPPSPLRLFQAIVDAAASRWRNGQFQEFAIPALSWLQELNSPEIVAPAHQMGSPFRIAVPNNDLDSPASAWAKGKEPEKPHRPIDLKTMKQIRPTHLLGNSLHYLFALPDGPCEHLEVLQAAARRITHLGWGIDMAVGDASIISAEDAANLEGVRWRPSPSGDVSLRAPKQGTLSDLMRKHTDFLNRISSDGFRPVPPLRVFDVVKYRSQSNAARSPFRLFELRNLDGSRFRYSHRKLTHISGMVRHLAIEAMKTAGLPRGVPNDWIETYVAGHKGGGSVEHRQLSYIPLPSVGHDHADPGIRRVMIVAPVGDDALLDHVARRLGGQQLVPVHGDEFAGGDPPLLVPLPRMGDGVTRRYTVAANTWYSFTPVILPGHDDHKPEKTRKLIKKALAQSGIDQPCEFEWSAFSRFPKSYSAHKYVRDENSSNGKRIIGYIRPDHLLDQTAVHLVLRFGHREDPNDPESRWLPAERLVPGPITLGAGRHCGFGLMAAADG